MSNLVKLTVYLVNVAADSACRRSQRMKVVTQSLGGGNRVDCCQLHDDFVHQRGALNLIDEVVLTIGE